MIRHLIVFTLLITTCFSQHSKAQYLMPSGSQQLLENWLEAQLEFDRLPSISVGIIKDQQLLWGKSFGKLDVAKNVPATPSTIYSICSITKLFTAVAILKLREDGKIRLDDPITQHLPWFKVKPYPNSLPITIRHLLTHSSGLPAEFDFPYWTDNVFPTKEQIMQKINDQTPLYPPGHYFQYSNFGITLLGYIIESVTGLTYDKYVTDNILSPLQLQDTRTYFPEELWRTKLAVGYSELSRKGERRMLNKFQTNGLASATGISSTVEDLARFIAWQFRTYTADEKEILEPETLREMQQVQYMDPNWRTTWGYGFKVVNIDNKTYSLHGGYCPGYQSVIAMNQKDKIGFVVLINAVGTDPYKYFEGMRAIMAKAYDDNIQHAPENPAMNEFCGLYRDAPWGSEVSLTRWGNHLAMINLPCDNPVKNMILFRPTENPDRFVRIREDGLDGEEIWFERDVNNKITKLWRHSNYRIKYK
jgi:CubicO group peptidase (beta-lactamase class C family)